MAKKRTQKHFDARGHAECLWVPDSRAGICTRDLVGMNHVRYYFSTLQ